MFRTLSPLSITRRRVSSHSLHARYLSRGVESDDSRLTISGKATFSHQWLRDSCQCSSCVHPTSLQKLHRSSDIPANIRPAPGGLTVTNNGVHISWIDGHESFYETDFLKRYSSLSERHRFHRDASQILWNTSSISRARDLFIPYKELRESARLLDAINQLTQYGLLFVTGVPHEHTSNDTCELRQLANTFGELRTTFYGELWDVKSVRNSRNIAYTNLDLDLHMDLLYVFLRRPLEDPRRLKFPYSYFQHPPRYQGLHCLRNRAVGGTSIFVDAIHAASLLRRSHPADFDVLATTRVPFHYINDGHHLHYEHPTIELDVYPSSCNALTSELPIKYINYSPPFQAPLMNTTPASFYAALGRFAALLDDASNRMEYTLREGDAVLFDNRRVLHARTAFTDESPCGPEACDVEINRWLKGCYLEADAILDRGRMLRTKVKKM